MYEMNVLICSQLNTYVGYRDSVAGSVIQATGTVEFEDGLRLESSLEASGTLVAAASSPGSMLHHPGGAGWLWG